MHMYVYMYICRYVCIYLHIAMEAAAVPCKPRCVSGNGAAGDSTSCMSEHTIGRPTNQGAFYFSSYCWLWSRLHELVDVDILPARP